MELVEIKAKTRGKNTREVTYKGVGKFVGEGEERHLVTAGVVTDIKDALSIEQGNMQSLLDNWAVGFNASAYKDVSDQLAEYVNDNWDPTQVAAFRLAVNNLIKLGMDVETAVAAAKNSPALKAKDAA